MDDSEPTEVRQPPSTAGTVRAFVVYSLARIGLFLGLWAALVAVSLSPLPAAVLAAVASLPLSLYLLAPQRARLAERIAASREDHRVIDPDRRAD